MPNKKKIVTWNYITVSKQIMINTKIVTWNYIIVCKQIIMINKNSYLKLYNCL